MVKHGGRLACRHTQNPCRPFAQMHPIFWERQTTLRVSWEFNDYQHVQLLTGSVKIGRAFLRDSLIPWTHKGYLPSTRDVRPERGFVSSVFGGVMYFPAEASDIYRGNPHVRRLSAKNMLETFQLYRKLLGRQLLGSTGIHAETSISLRDILIKDEPFWRVYFLLHGTCARCV